MSEQSASWVGAFGQWLLWLGTAMAAMPAVAAPDPWWTRAVIYEIYPRSFQDSDGDGVGDLNGITRRLDYLQQLGVDAIWIAPVFPSPQVDFGYDVADYERIDPQFGTLGDFDRLVAQARARGIRVLLDMVLNHTSDQHAWFRGASSSRTDPRHDWYVWNDGRRGSDGARLPPNNWVSLFGGSAWQWVPAVQQFYYHEFYRQQPDLNWRNPEVQTAMLSTLDFWLKRGVAGFRLDAITTLFEDAGLRNEPVEPGTNAQGDPIVSRVYTDNLPEVHGTIRRLRKAVDAHSGDPVPVGETYLPNTAELDRWYGGSRHDELHLPMDLLVGFINKLDGPMFQQRLREAYSQLHGSPPLLVLDNHDNVRSWDRYGDGVHNLQIAKLLATLLLTSRAAVLLYQGEELGLITQTPVRVEDVRDPIGISGWPREKGRDGERVPMPWDGSNAQAGFTTSTHPWLPMPASYRSLNAAAATAVPDSLLNWHRQLLNLRHEQPALRSGDISMLDLGQPGVVAWIRSEPQAHSAVLVALNMSAQSVNLDLRALQDRLGAGPLSTLLSSPKADLAVQNEQLLLDPFAAFVGITPDAHRGPHGRER